MTAERVRPHDPFLLINPTFLLLLSCAQSRLDGTSAAADAQEGEDVESEPQEAQEEESEQTTTISENQNNLAFFGGLNRQGYAVASTQFDDGTFVGFLKKHRASWKAFTYTAVYRQVMDLFMLGVISIVFLGLMAVARRRKSERYTKPAGAFWEAWPVTFRFVSRLLIFSVLLLGILPSIPQHTVEASLPLGTFYYHGDHLGSSSIITDLNGDVVEEAVYKPFGEFHQKTESSSVKHYYTGQELDEETDLYYYGARYYNPEIARFISSDSIVASPFDPQDLNRYAYTRNNPIIYIDPTGHGFGDFLKKWAPTIISIVIGVTLTYCLGPAGAGMMSWVQAGMVGGAAAGFAGGVMSGGGFRGGAIGALIGGIAGGIGAGVGGQFADKPFLGALAGGAAGGAAAAALGAIVQGQNVFEAAIIGGITGAAMAAAMYGAVAAIKGSMTITITVEGETVTVKIGLRTKISPEDLAILEKHWPVIEKVLLDRELLFLMSKIKDAIDTRALLGKGSDQLTFTKSGGDLKEIGYNNSLKEADSAHMIDTGRTEVKASFTPKQFNKVDAFLSVHAIGPTHTLEDITRYAFTYKKYHFFFEGSGGDYIFIVIPNVDHSIYLGTIQEWQEAWPKRPPAFQ